MEEGKSLHDYSFNQLKKLFELYVELGGNHGRDQSTIYESFRKTVAILSQYGMSDVTDDDVSKIIKVGQTSLEDERFAKSLRKIGDTMLKGAPKFPDK